MGKPFKLNSFRKLPLVGLTLLLTNSPVIAEDLERIVVIGRTENTTIMDMAANVNIVDSAEIQLSGATNVVELLRGRFGIQISDNNTNAVISMRGFTAGQAANNTLILVDGRRLNNIDIAAPALSAIPVNMIERIEVLSGSAGVLYGDQAVGGVINIITRAPDRDGGNISVSGGSFDTREIRGDYAGKFADNWHYYFSGSQKNSDNYRNNNESKTGAILGRIGYKDETTDFYAESSYFDNDVNTPGALSKEQFKDDPRQSLARFIKDYQHDVTFAARSGISQIISDNWLSAVDLNYTDSQINSYASFSSGGGSPLINERDTLLISPKFVGNYVIEQGTLNIILGSDISVGHSKFSFGRSNTQTQINLFVQATVPLTQNLSYIIGGRHGRVEDDLQDANHSNPIYKNGVNLKNEANALELGLNYQLTEKNRFYLRAEDNFRFAKVDEQAYTLPNIIGLKPQTGRSYEAGWDYNQNSVQARLNFYRLDLKNEIVYDYSVHNPVSYNQHGANVNADKSRRYGINTSLDWMVFTNLQTGIEYNYIDAEFTEGVNKGKKLSWVAPHSARTYASYDITSEWQFYADIVYTGRRYLEGDDSNSNAKLPSHTLFNLAINYSYQSWLASLRVNNIFDKQYASAAYMYLSKDKNGNVNPPSFSYYSGTGRAIFLTVNYAF